MNPPGAPPSVLDSTSRTTVGSGHDTTLTEEKQALRLQRRPRSGWTGEKSSSLLSSLPASDARGSIDIPVWPRSPPPVGPATTPAAARRTGTPPRRRRGTRTLAGANQTPAVRNERQRGERERQGRDGAEQKQLLARGLQRCSGLPSLEMIKYHTGAGRHSRCHPELYDRTPSTSRSALPTLLIWTLSPLTS